jgi:5-formyltetrahydrofolate cyclo-ligase
MSAREKSSSKAEVRSAMIPRRRELARAAPDAAARAAGLAPDARLAACAVVGGYRPMGGEMDPRPLLARFRAMGCRLVMPAALGRDEALVFRLADAGFDLVPDAFGIPSPSPLAPEMRPDVVITPVLAFDPSGARLGRGAGCYDRTLAALRASGRVFAMGLAYAGQRVESLAAEPHDEGLDAILTEEGYIEFPKDGACG